MQEEISNKTLVFCSKGAKMTGRSLRDIFRAFLKHRHNKAHARNCGVVSHGKQSLKQLQKQGQELTNIPISDDNIKSFERYARKYGIDFCLKADKTEEPPCWYAFFKARDAKVMEAAFKEYAGKEIRNKKPSIRQKLKALTGRAIQHRERTREKSKNRSETL